MKNEAGFKMKLGMFVTIGLILFIVVIYLVGKQKNLFGSNIRLKAQFKNVSGLKVGNNVRFSGINVGTIDEIGLVNDTTVLVEMVVRKEIQQFIKSDASASIGSDGLMGDKVLTIAPGLTSSSAIKDNAMLKSQPSIEMEQLMTSVKTSLDNAGIITGQLAEFTFKMNNGNGALSKLISDEGLSSSLKNTLTNLQTSTNEFAKFTTKMNNEDGALAKLSDPAFGEKLDSTMSNLQAGTKGLSENMEAAKSNFLLRGFFKKKKKAEAKKEAALKKEAEKKRKADLKMQKTSQAIEGKVPATVVDTLKNEQR
ncbi:MAG: MlaD family protein [Ferruginibacter sp.]